MLESSGLPEQIINFPLNLLTRFDQKNSLQLRKSVRNPHKIANELKTVASGIINLRSKQDLICHAAKVKAAMSLFKAIFRVVVISLLMT